MLSFEAQGVANSLHSEHSLARSSSGVSFGAFVLLKRVNSVPEQACHFATQVSLKSAENAKAFAHSYARMLS